MVTQSSENQQLSASLEDYLEAIFRIVSEKQVARAKDIARRLGVGGSSVTGALRSLAERKLINYAPYEIITLTAEGKKVAEAIFRRHQALTHFFVRVLKIDETEAEASACKLEHAISKTVMERLVQFAEFLETCPRGGFDWIKEFGYHCESGKHQENCERCLSTCLESANKNSPNG